MEPKIKKGRYQGNFSPIQEENNDSNTENYENQKIGELQEFNQILREQANANKINEKNQIELKPKDNLNSNSNKINNEDEFIQEDLLTISVDIDEDKTVILHIKANDNLEEITDQFCNEYNLGQDQKLYLQNHIKENLTSFFGDKIDQYLNIKTNPINDHNEEKKSKEKGKITDPLSKESNQISKSKEKESNSKFEELKGIESKEKNKINKSKNDTSNKSKDYPSKAPLNNLEINEEKQNNTFKEIPEAKHAKPNLNSDQRSNLNQISNSSKDREYDLNFNPKIKSNISYKNKDLKFRNNPFKMFNIPLIDSHSAKLVSQKGVNKINVYKRLYEKSIKSRFNKFKTDIKLNEEGDKTLEMNYKAKTSISKKASPTSPKIDKCRNIILYQNGLRALKDKEMKSEQIRKDREKKETENSTFYPKINISAKYSSKRSITKLQDELLNLHKTLELKRKKRQEELENERKSVCTFRPSISSTSELIDKALFKKKSSQDRCLKLYEERNKIKMKLSFNSNRDKNKLDILNHSGYEAKSNFEKKEYRSITSRYLII